jgi:hypothetical protein
MKKQHIVALLILIVILVYVATCGFGGSDNNSAASINYADSLRNDSLVIADSLVEAVEDPPAVQYRINRMIEQEVENAKRTGYVKAMLADFELGMSKRQVRKHMLKMKQKKHLVRVQKSANLFEYVYRLPLENGKSNTYMDFEYSRKGGVFKSICHPSKFRKMTKTDFLEEIKTLFAEWYGAPDFEVSVQNACKRYIWITGNQHLDLYCTSKKVEFVYTDLNFEIPPNIEGGGAERPNVKLML